MGRFLAGSQLWSKVIDGVLKDDGRLRRFSVAREKRAIRERISGIEFGSNILFKRDQ